MKVKIIAVKKLYKTQPGDSLEVPSNVAVALVRMGSARYADDATADIAAAVTAAEAPAAAQAPRRRGPGRPRKDQTTAATNIGAITTEDMPQQPSMNADDAQS